MPTRLKARMMGRVVEIGLPGTGASHPKYSTMTTAMNAQSSIRNLPCVTR
jgi:hypothetical protein